MCHSDPVTFFISQLTPEVVCLLCKNWYAQIQFLHILKWNQIDAGLQFVRLHYWPANT